jgi:hypothetical protein
VPTLIIDGELREKIHRRAERAFKNFDEGSDEHVTRCHQVQKDSLRYRISHRIAGTSGHYSGPNILVKRVVSRRWYPPWTLKTNIVIPEKVEDEDHIIDIAK